LPVPRHAVEVRPGVLVATSRRDTTTSTIVVRGRAVLIVDPAWEPDELARLAELVSAGGWRVSAGFATHAHHDHLLWHPRFGRAPRYASPKTAELATTHRLDLQAALGADWPAELLTLVGDVQAVAGPGLPVDEPAELVVHDGHAPGHAALWLPERQVLLAGDMLSDVELPLPLWPDDLPSYVAGLDALAPYVRRAQVLVPGHGHPTDNPAARLAADRAYLSEMLRGRDPDDPRRANPGMAEVHRHIRALVRGSEEHRSGP